MTTSPLRPAMPDGRRLLTRPAAAVRLDDDPPQPSNHTLLTAAAAGDEGAWEQVVIRYERLVYSIPLHYGLDAEDAADVMQSTFVTLMESLDRLRDHEYLGSWLATVARRKSWRLLDRSRRARDAERDGAALADDEDDPIGRWEGTAAVYEALDRLDERSRELLTALYFDPSEPSYAEVAERFGMAVGSVGPTRARCLARLRQVLEDF